MATYVIVGGVAGGASAAARLRRCTEHDEIIMLERGDYISFANCGLPYYIGGTIQERNKLLVQTPEAMRERFNIDVRTGSNVVAIDRVNKTVSVESEGKTYLQRYDKLLLSPGSSPVRPPLPGVDGPRVFTVWNIPDTDKIASFLQTHPCKRAVVVGGGFIGIEMAENLHEVGLDVTMVEMLPQVMNNVDWEMAQYLHMELNRNGIHLRLGSRLTSIEDLPGGCRVHLADGAVLDADLVIMAAGVRPNSELAKNAGLELGPRGHIVVNSEMQTSDPDIYAVGDAIEVVDYMTGTKTAVPLAGPANKQGRIVADNMLGGHKIYAGTQGTSVAKVFTKTVACTGLSEKRLAAMGKKLHVDYEAVIGHSNNHAGYYPGATPLHIKVIYELPTGKILGAQAVGEEGTEKRIDVIATCIRYGGVMDDLCSLELAYAPPFNTAKDPVNFAGFMAENIAAGMVQILHVSELEDLDPAIHQLVDIRTEAEHLAGTIPGSIHVSLDSLRKELCKLDKNKIQVVYCRAGLRSYIAARILNQNGFKTLSMTGGWLSYEAETYRPE